MTKHFLSREEYDRLLEVIRCNYPRQAPAFIVSVFTGMRWEEQDTTAHGGCSPMA
jgi:hypothetical protein